MLVLILVVTTLHVIYLGMYTKQEHTFLVLKYAAASDHRLQQLSPPSNATDTWPNQLVYSGIIRFSVNNNIAFRSSLKYFMCTLIAPLQSPSAANGPCSHCAPP